MLTCAACVELVTAYLEDALDEVGQRRFVAHVATCVGCDRYLAQIRATIEGLRELSSEDPGGVR